MIAKLKNNPNELYSVTATLEFNMFTDGLILFVVLKSFVTNETIKLTVENFNGEFEIVTDTATINRL